MKETGISYTILFLSMSKELNEKVVPLHPIIFPWTYNGLAHKLLLLMIIFNDLWKNSK